MARAAPIITSFNAGEFAPTLDGRVDLQRYPNGAKLKENFIPLVQGPDQRRAGTRFVAELKDSNQRVWLERFEFSASQHYTLEFGHEYIRFYTQHGQLLSGGVPYEVATPYQLADLTNNEGAFALAIEQSGDVLYIAAAGYRPRTLTRIDTTNWVLAEYSPINGPFDDQNTDQNIVVWTFGHVLGSTVAVNSNADIFAPTDVGRLMRIQSQNIDVSPWQNELEVNAGDQLRFDGRTYKALNSATTGPSPPIHDSGTARDGPSGVFWEYQDAGYGIVRITEYVHARQVMAEVLMQLPVGVVGAPAANPITAITQADPAVVTCEGHGFSNDKSVYIEGVEGMTQVNNKFFLTAGVATDTLELAEVDSTNYSAYTTGGTVIINATSRWAFGAWSDTTGYPTAVAFAYDRLWWARGIDLWGSVPGKYDDMAADTAGLVTFDSAISRKLTAQEVNNILWLVAADRLIIGTPGGEFALGPITTVDPVGPENVQVPRQSQRRCRNVRPQIVGTSILYVQRAGRKVLSLDYAFEIEKYRSSNKSVLAPHITKSGIVDMAYQSEPDSVLWVVLANGSLVAYTYDEEQEVSGWHRHPIGGDGFVEAVETVPSPDGDRDEVWLVVRRTINGATRRYIEFIERPWEAGDDQADMFYVDSGLTYDGAPATVISGLSHLEGQTVQVCADGASHPDKVVVGGQITLDRAASVVHVGLKCRARIITMRIEAGGQAGTAQGKIKKFHEVMVRLVDTLGGKIGMEGRTLTEIQYRTPSMPMNQPPPIFTGDKLVTLDGDYETDGRLEIVQDQPFPMTVAALMPELRTHD
jgi:hypothetical protein